MESYLLPRAGEDCRRSRASRGGGGDGTPYPVPRPRPVAFPAQVSQPIRYGFDSLRRFATE